MMTSKQHNRRNQKGMSLIELMIACLVLAIGMVGSLALLLMAISGNNRNKLDSTGTMLAQMVIEQINVRPATDNSLIPVTDCGTPATNFQIAVQAGPQPTGNGAPLVQNQADPNYGRIDWLQPAPGNNYSFNYTACDGSVYDVRWNVMTVTGNTRLITVSARRLGSNRNLRFFAIPVHLRTISGP